MARYALTDNEFKTIEELITYSPERGSKPTQIREMFDGLIVDPLLRRAVAGLAGPVPAMEKCLPPLPVNAL